MKAYYFSTICLLFFGVQGISQKLRIDKARVFINSLVADSSISCLKKSMIIERSDKEVDIYLQGFIDETKKNLNILLDGNNINRYQIVPYLKLNPSERVFFPLYRKTHEDIYSVVIDDKILAYLLFKKHKIASFYYISKGGWGGFIFFNTITCLTKLRPTNRALATARPLR